MHNSISILFTIECKKIFAHTVWSGEPLHTVRCLTIFISVGVLSNGACFRPPTSSQDPVSVLKETFCAKLRSCFALYQLNWKRNAMFCQTKIQMLTSFRILTLVLCIKYFEVYLTFEPSFKTREICLLLDLNYRFWQVNYSVPSTFCFVYILHLKCDNFGPLYLCM